MAKSKLLGLEVFVVDKETKKYIDEKIADALNKVTVLTLKMQLDQEKEKKVVTNQFSEVNKILKTLKENSDYS